MPFYYYLFSIILLLIISAVVHFFIQRRKDIPLELFVAALKDENNGYFEAAVVTYESALDEVKKNRFRSSDLKNKIIEKLKILHAFIEYENHPRR
jgi:hypothetical protein